MKDLELWTDSGPPISAHELYLVRLISVWYCNWFMLFMTLDMPDEGTR